ncbi:MAG: hypothetical protein SOR81_01480 [Fusobacterium sp.]|uniref:hypothetical protein n=1 Tax=Fusobacterium sp. TaxID=68766 RepID=UPI002A75AAA1|nr:hypothetical protein [Fusobacterium sp.]MDY2980270.1 hypothetical protein [Fusobacterium sp.]
MMEILKDFIFEEIEEKIKSDSYNVVYLNYDKANGIKILYNLESLSQDEKENFYRMYIFNDEYMMTVYNFGENEYKYTKILKEDFEKDSIREKEIYLVENKDIKEKKLKVRLGNIEGRESLQYLGFIGGDK